MLTFGPVPSRRLGRSLGINNIPPKACSYSCVYCQVGPTPLTEIEPRAFYEPARILAEVQRHLERLEGTGERVDYLTFVPDGEPTLDARLGETLDHLRPLGLRLAVITNGSLLFRETSVSVSPSRTGCRSSSMSSTLAFGAGSTGPIPA